MQALSMKWEQWLPESKLSKLSDTGAVFERLLGHVMFCMKLPFASLILRKCSFPLHLKVNTLKPLATFSGIISHNTKHLHILTIFLILWDM